MTLSHVVMLGGGSDDGGSADGVSCGGAAIFAMMAWASAKALFCASRASFVFLDDALPAATRFGFFCFVVGVFEVTCEVTCGSAMYFTE